MLLTHLGFKKFCPLLNQYILGITYDKEVGKNMVLHRDDVILGATSSLSIFSSNI
jgi:hypothetical protein